MPTATSGDPSIPFRADGRVANRKNGVRGCTWKEQKIRSHSHSSGAKSESKSPRTLLPPRWLYSAASVTNTPSQSAHTQIWGSPMPSHSAAAAA
jgi:microcystin-dependent protein